MMKKPILLLLVLLIYLVSALLYVNKVIPQGDEIHFLLISQSLLNDGDIYLENNYEQKDYKIYTNLTLDEHATTGIDGHKYSFHDLGLPLITFPFFTLFGRIGISLFISIISFVLIIFIYKLSLKITKSEKASILATLSFALSAPTLFYSHLIFTEILASLLIVSFLVSSNISIILLPWLNIRYLPVLVLLLLIIVMKEKKKAVPFILISLLSTFIYFLFNYRIYGTLDPTFRYIHANLPVGGGNIIVNSINILFDRQYGLFVYAPFYLLVIPGIFIWRKLKNNKLYTVIIISLIYILPILNFRDWHGGYNPPPARYILPILPLWIPAIAFVIKYFKKKSYPFLIFSLIFGIILYLRGIVSTPNHGFAFQDGLALYIQEIQDFLPHFFPQRSLELLHYLYILIFIVYVFVSWKLAKNDKT